MPSWQDYLRPCFACAGSGPDLYLSAGNSILGLRWPGTSPNDYEAACARCELHIALNDETRALVLHHLRYDKRDQGSHGRALRSDIPSLGVLANDRLEPCPALPDVSNLKYMDMPATIVFWRPSEETVCRHRHPLFSADLGLSIFSLTVDALHALYIGAMNK